MTANALPANDTIELICIQLLHLKPLLAIYLVSIIFTTRLVVVYNSISYDDYEHFITLFMCYVYLDVPDEVDPKKHQRANVSAICKRLHGKSARRNTVPQVGG